MATRKAPSTYKQPQPNKNSLGNNGYPATDVKTAGKPFRGAGAQTKGKLSRGPLA